MTRERDVDVACSLGVDAVGFVLWPSSPRAIAAPDAARLIARLPASVTPVGVFVRPTRDEIVDAIDSIGIRVAQVHDVKDFSPLARLPCDLWVAASLNGSLDLVPSGLTVLLDAHDPKRHGGTGQMINWEDAGRIAATRRVMLAGGLTPGNVAQAISHTRPYGVDVASGIEDRPGVKIAQLMKDFVDAVRNAP